MVQNGRHLRNASHALATAKAAVGMTENAKRPVHKFSHNLSDEDDLLEDIEEHIPS